MEYEGSSFIGKLCWYALAVPLLWFVGLFTRGGDE